MSITSYTELLTATANWLARDDLAARIPEFIALTEAKLNRSLRCRQMETRSAALVNLASAEPQYISLPSDFQTMRSVCLSSLTERPRLQMLTDEQLKDYRSNIGDTTAAPRYFGIFGTEMELVPNPDLAYTVEMVYRANIPPLTAAAPTNWLITLAPDAYLYGVMLEASVFIDRDERLQTWLAGYTSAIDTLNGVTKEVVGTDGGV